MASRILLCVCVCTVSWGMTCAAFAGAWTQKWGGYYFKLAAGYLNSTKDIDADGKQVEKASMGELRDLNYSAYLEYGLLDRLTLVASAPYKRLRDIRTLRDLNSVVTGTALEKRSGFGDLEVRLRWRLASQPLVVSVAAGGKVPLWYGEDNGTRVPLSSKEADVDVRLLLGRSLYPFPGYVTGEVGYRIRDGFFSNEVLYFLEAGIMLNRLLLKGSVSGIHTSGECNPMGEVELIGDQNVLKLSPGVILRLTDWMELGVDLVSVAGGCNTSAGHMLLFGVAFKR